MLRVLLTLVVLILSSCGLLNHGENSNDQRRTIVFSASAESGTSQIYISRENGSGVKQLTNSRENWAIDPKWSPGGTRIAYAKFTPSLGSETLWVMETDGSNQRPLITNPTTGTPQIGNSPNWFPNGKKLLFDKCMNCEQGGNNFEIFLADLETGTIDTLTNHTGRDFEPALSPDGSQIAFISNRENETGNDIYLMDADGKNITRLTNTGNAGRQIWLPEGNQLIYWSNNNLYRVNLKDTTQAKIKAFISPDIGIRPLDVSPDGNRLLLHTFNLDKPGQEQSLQILNLVDSEINKINSFPEIRGGDWTTDY